MSSCRRTGYGGQGHSRLSGLAEVVVLVVRRRREEVDFLMLVEPKGLRTKKDAGPESRRMTTANFSGPDDWMPRLGRLLHWLCPGNGCCKNPMWPPGWTSQSQPEGRS
jgi:hypothetical protein